VSTWHNPVQIVALPTTIGICRLRHSQEHSVIERRVDHARRKRVSEMSPEEMRQALLVSEKTGLPNRRAFDESKPSAWVAICDVNGLKALNDAFGYSAGDILIRRLAEVLTSVEVDAYHDKGDEFLCRGNSYQELNEKLFRAQRLLNEEPFVVWGLDGRIASVPGADFCFGIGTDLEEAERSLKHQKELRKLER
jgi:GGDEF domain-containing protein